MNNGTRGLASQSEDPRCLSGVDRIARVTRRILNTYGSIVTVLATQFLTSLGCSDVGGGVLGPSFPPPIFDTFNCESVN